MENTILTHYQLFSFNKDFWGLSESERKDSLHNWVEAIKKSSEKVNFYQVYPSRESWDILVWTSNLAEELHVPDQYFENFGKATNVFRQYIEPGLSLWGMTKPSVYSKAKKNPQEIDPYDDESRTPYFVIYPFVKTIPWYLEPWDTRKEMMNEHIKLGKQYPEITQLLLYCFGLQDQEFVVAYETENLSQFSDLVYELRKSEARRYTERDTPIITAVHRTPEKLEEIFC